MSRYIATIALALVLTATSAQADPITVQAVGHAELSWPSLDALLESVLGTPFQSGTPFSTLVTFDAAAQDLLPDEPRRGEYLGTDMSLALGTNNYTLQSPVIAVGNGSNGDTAFMSGGLDSVFGVVPITMELIWFKNSLDSDSLPLDELVLNSADLKLLSIGEHDLGFRGVWTVDSVAVSTVPEPSTFLLLGTGLTGFGVRRWRQRKA